MSRIFLGLCLKDHNRDIFNESQIVYVCDKYMNKFICVREATLVLVQVLNHASFNFLCVLWCGA